MRRPVTLPTALLGVVALVAAVFTSPHVGDYVIDQPSSQIPAPAIQALADGSVGDFIDLHPVMGSFSLLLRAPLVALSDWLGGSRLLGHRLGVLVCFIPRGVVGGMGWGGAEVV